MAVARSLFVSVSCTALVLAALLAPRAARADSDGVPPIAGAWSGKLTDVYFDQTSDGSLKPKQKFKSNVTVIVAQATGQITMTINFQDPFPVDGSTGVSQFVLNGYVGNNHMNASMDGAASVTFSGVINKKGNSLTLEGFAASTEFTHELKIKLKLQSN
jgi:hypothetical protein